MAAPANARRVDERNILAFPLQRRIERVARGAGDGTHDGSILLQESVEQRGLANVGPAHDRDVDAMILWRFLCRRNLRYDLIQQVAGARAVMGRDRICFAQTELVELERALPASFVVRLVHCQHHWSAGTSQYLGHVLIGGRDSILRIDQEDDDIGLLDGDLSLLPDLAHEIARGGAERLGLIPLLARLVRSGNIEPAGIDHDEGLARPFRLAIETIARGAWLILDDGPSLADQAG